MSSIRLIRAVQNKERRWSVNTNAVRQTIKAKVALQSDLTALQQVTRNIWKSMPKAYVAGNKDLVAILVTSKHMAAIHGSLSC